MSLKDELADWLPELKAGGTISTPILKLLLTNFPLQHL